MIASQVQLMRTTFERFFTLLDFLFSIKRNIDILVFYAWKELKILFSTINLKSLRPKKNHLHKHSQQ